MTTYLENLKANERYYKEKLEKTREGLCESSIEDLLDDLVDAYSTYREYLHRDDGIYWTPKVEEYVRDIYFSIRTEILQRVK